MFLVVEKKYFESHSARNLKPSLMIYFRSQYNVMNSMVKDP